MKQQRDKTTDPENKAIWNKWIKGTEASVKEKAERKKYVDKQISEAKEKYGYNKVIGIKSQEIKETEKGIATIQRLLASAKAKNKHESIKYYESELEKEKENLARLKAGKSRKRERPEDVPTVKMFASYLGKGDLFKKN